MWSFSSMRRLLPLCLLSALPVGVLGSDILTSDGYSMCLNDPNIQVQRLNVTYDRQTRLITFDVAGSSKVEMNVTVDLVITAYGQQVYTRTFNPCDIHDVNMPQICPVPATSFSSIGQEVIPAEYASQIPSIAFNIPDLDGLVQLTLKNSDEESIACIQSSITNGHSFNIPSISYAAAGVAAAALAFSAVGAVASAGHPGASSSSPSFGETIGWFQGLATGGMLSVPYPKVYQSFTTNFAFSTGLVPWAGLQQTIDNFRKNTGGNLTHDSYDYLANNATLEYDDGKMNTSLRIRALDSVGVFLRDTVINVNGTSQNINSGNSTGSTGNITDTSSKEQHYVSGIQAYVEQLTIPQANTFMTVLLIWAIAVGAIIVLILLLKIILEAWSMIGSLPKSMESWRKRYWWRLAKVLTNLVLLLYGVWTLYCIYQFTNGDSWAAKLLAGVTLALFTGVLLGFTWKIHAKAHEYKKLEGDSKRLYDDKEVWIKYSLFYDNYKRSYWWLFVPAIVYMFAKGCIIAGANGHGLIQASGQLIVEALMLILLLWTRPFQRRSSQWVNITIQTVRVLSVGCVLIFVEELGISQTTKTITGVILIVVQCILTGILAILIAVNAIIGCIKENPHRRARKDAEKNAALDRDFENLTPLNPRNSLLMESVQKGPDTSMYKAPLVSASPFADSARGRYDPVREHSPAPTGSSRPSRFERDDERLLPRAASMGRRSRDGDSVSRSPSREPRLPELPFGRAM